jgi:hypothetical protein
MALLGIADFPSAAAANPQQLQKHFAPMPPDSAPLAYPVAAA